MRTELAVKGSKLKIRGKIKKVSKLLKMLTENYPPGTKLLKVLKNLKRIGAQCHE